MATVTRRSTPRLAPLCAVAILAPALASCGGTDSLAEDVGRAADRIVATSGAGGAAAPADVRAEAYDAVVRDLQSGVARADGSTAGAARLVLARAMMGQGEIAADRARAGEFEVIHDLARVRSAFDRYMRTRIAGEAISRAGRQHPEAQFGDAERALRDQIVEARRSLEALIQQERQKLEQAGEARTNADRFTVQAQQIGEKAVDLPSAQRPRAFEDRYVLQRRAAEYLRKEQRLLDDAGIVQGEIEDQRQRVASLERRRDLLADARERVETAERLREEEARTALTEAERMGDEVAERFLSLLDAYEESVRPHYEEASRVLASAAQQAQSARRDVPETAGPIIGAARHADAALQRSRAELVDRIVALGERIGGAVAEASDLRDRVSTLGDSSETVRASAAEAYAAAASAYQGVRASGDVGQSFEWLARRMAVNEALLKGEEPPAPPEQPEPARDRAPDVELAPEPEPAPEPEQPQPAPAARQDTGG